MSILKNIESTFEKNGIKYFKGNKSTENMFSVPYRGIKNHQNHVNIYLYVDDSLKNIKFTFVEKINNSDIEYVKTKLLDINSALNFGNLAMRSDSDSVEYKVDYQLNDESFSFEQYNRFIVRCVNVYEILKDEKII